MIDNFYNKMKNLVLLVIFLLTVINSISQTGYRYFLLDKFTDSDLPEISYNKIDRFIGNEKLLLEKVFYPVKGTFTVYRFLSQIIIDRNIFSISVSKRYAYDIILLKEKNNKIIDGYRFPLYWTEVPSKAGLFRVNSVVTIKDSVAVESLKFNPIYKEFNNLFINTDFKKGILYFFPTSLDVSQGIKKSR